MIKSFNIPVEKFIYGLIAAALGIKITLFFYTVSINQRSILAPDSSGYLNDARAWVQYFRTPAEGFQHSIYRTPGYSLFLALFHFGMNLPLFSVVFLQIVLNILTAIIVFKTISSTDRQVGLLSAAIVLLDVPTMVYSNMILTESLHMFVISLFLYTFVKYINNRHLGWLLGSSVLLTASIYIRPVGYFLGFATAGFILYLWGAKRVKTGINHALLVLVFVYGSLVVWQYHNLKINGHFTFCTIDHATIRLYGIIGRYAKETNPHFRAMPPPLYYAVTVGSNFLKLMTSPGSMRYFSKGWGVFGAVFGYMVVVFWWLGLISGVRLYWKEVVTQFFLLVLLYFIAVSLVSTGWGVTSRFRVPMVPFLAILSARGWMALMKPSNSK